MELPVVHVKFSCKDKDEFKQRYEAGVLKKGILARATVSHEVGAHVKLNLEVEDGTFAIDEEAVVLGHELVRGKQAMRLKLARVVSSGTPPKLAPVTDPVEWLEPIKTGEALAFDPKAPPSIAPVVSSKVNGHAADESPMKVTTSPAIVEPDAALAPAEAAAKKKPPVLIIAGAVGLLVIGGAVFALTRKPSAAPPTQPPAKVVEAPKPAPPAPVPLAAPAPAPIVAPAPPAPAPVSNTVKVSISSTPSGAKVLANGKSAGQTPLNLTVPKGQRLKLDFSASGYKPAGKVLNPGEDASVEVTLKKSGPKNDLKDVY